MTRQKKTILCTLVAILVIGYLASQSGWDNRPSASPQSAQTDALQANPPLPASEELAARVAKLERELQLLRATAKLPVIDQEKERARLADTNTPIFPLTFQSNGSEIDDPFLGSPSAPVTLIAFSNYTCLTCDRFFNDTFPKLKKEYIDTNKLRFILRDLPVARGGTADTLSIAANCAGAQGKYWEAHSLISKRKNQSANPAALLRGIAGIDSDKLTKCLKNTRYQREIADDVADAKRLGATGAPSFVIGVKNGENYTGVFLRGAQPLSLFRAQIAKLLPANS